MKKPDMIQAVEALMSESNISMEQLVADEVIPIKPLDNKAEKIIAKCGAIEEQLDLLKTLECDMEKWETKVFNYNDNP